MAFDGDAYLAALEPPTFSVGGKTYRGILLSVPEWLEIHQEKESLQNAEFDKVTAWTVSVVRRMFPKKWYQPFNRAVVAFTRLPFAAQVAALEDFCESQRKAMPSPPPGNQE